VLGAPVDGFLQHPPGATRPAGGTPADLLAVAGYGFALLQPADGVSAGLAYGAVRRGGGVSTLARRIGVARGTLRRLASYARGMAARAQVERGGRRPRAPIRLIGASWRAARAGGPYPRASVWPRWRSQARRGAELIGVSPLCSGSMPFERRKPQRSAIFLRIPCRLPGCGLPTMTEGGPRSQPQGQSGHSFGNQIDNRTCGPGNRRVRYVPGPML
jgi:hypothetical protein